MTKKKYYKNVLLLAIEAGVIMLKSGAEVSRVEDTISRICKACGVDYVNVFATPTGIFVAMDRDEDDDDTYTYIRRIKSMETDLGKISRVNKFSREFTSTSMSAEEGMTVLEDIEKQKPYPFVIRLLAAAMVAGCFALLFGGNALDFLVAVIGGVFCYTLSRFLEKYDINFFIRGMCCTALAAVIALIAAAAIPAASYGYIITGCLMLFVPGVQITNSIRDFLSGDMLSGVARMAEAFLVAVSLAAGAGIVLKIWNMIGGVTL